MQISRNKAISNNYVNFGKVKGDREILLGYVKKPRITILDKMSDRINCDLIVKREYSTSLGDAYYEDTAYLIPKTEGIERKEDIQKNKVPVIECYTPSLGPVLEICPSIYVNAVKGLCLHTAKKKLTEDATGQKLNDPQDYQKWMNTKIYSLESISNFFKNDKSKNRANLEDMCTADMASYDRFIKRIVKNEKQVRRDMPKEKLESSGSIGFHILGFIIGKYSADPAERYFWNKNPYETGLLNNDLYDEKGKRIR